MLKHEETPVETTPSPSTSYSTCVRYLDAPESLEGQHTMRYDLALIDPSLLTARRTRDCFELLLGEIARPVYVYLSSHRPSLFPLFLLPYCASHVIFG